MTKRTKADIFRILASTESYSVLAEQEGLSSSGIGKIKTGRMYPAYHRDYVANFGPVPRFEPGRMIDQQTHAEILASALSNKEIDEKLRLTPGYASQIRKGTRYMDWFEAYVAEHGEPGPWDKSMRRVPLGHEHALQILRSKLGHLETARALECSTTHVRNVLAGKAHRDAWLEYHGRTSQPVKPRSSAPVTATRMGWFKTAKGEQYGKRQATVIPVTDVRVHPMITQAWTKGVAA